MTVTKYFGKIKARVDTLRDICSLLTDEELVINVLSRLNKFINCIPKISASQPSITSLQAQYFLLQEKI